ncbi:MAG TPA: hypothetical protein VFJ13_05445 [Paracoccaceae bacterium]|nr:hypothetical protein [Paracoccaceae bacterium]
MSGRSATRLIGDPRTVILAVVSLVAAGLWLALWQSMAGMEMPAVSDMAAHASVAMPGMTSDSSDWSAAPVASTAAMWLLILAAMMLPAIASMMATYAGSAELCQIRWAGP